MAHIGEVKPTEALALVRGYASAGRFVVAGHARQRMRERSVSFADLRHALVNAKRCSAQENERWKVFSTDLDDDDLTVIVALEDDVVVVTVF